MTMCTRCGTGLATNCRRLFCSDDCRLAARQDKAAAARAVRVAAEDKHCSRCDATKSKSSFDSDRRRFDGLFPYCKDCRRAYNGSEPRPVRPRSAKVRAAERYANMTVPEAIQYRRDKHLWSTYRLTPDQYDVMLAAQDGVCAICRQPEGRGSSVYGRPGQLAVDHDHRCCPGRTSCGRCVSGLLCRACNQGIGSFGDDADRVVAALAYLRRTRT